MAAQKTERKTWPESLHDRIAQAIRDTRGRADMSAQDVANLTEKLGYPISRDKIANYESGRKQGLDVTELLIIAAALRVPPVTLIFGGPPDEPVEILPRRHDAAMVHGLAWLSGDPSLADEGITDPDTYNATLLRLIRERARVQGQLELLDRVITDFESRGVGQEHRADDLQLAGALMGQINEINRQITNLTEGEPE